MKNSKIQTISFITILLTLISFSCSENKKQDTITEKQLNVTILIDLSDRITPEIGADQVERDKQLIRSILKVVKDKIRVKGTFTSEDKINFMFYPHPDDSNIGAMASVLNFDLARLSPPDRKKLYTNIDSIYSINLDKLYDMALNSKSFDGSDIWRFFKDEIKDKCIVDKPNYENVLVILTDGYIYWKDTKFNNKNRYSYLLPTAAQLTRFRNNNNWEQEFDKEDYGLIPANKNLSNLKVLVLEVNPANSHPDDYDIIKKYLSKWFLEMGVSQNDFKILKTDLPVYTKPIVEDFLSK